MRMDKDKLLKKYLDNQCSPQEVKALFEAIEKGEVEDFEQTLKSGWDDIEEFAELSQNKKQQLNKNILNQIHNDKPKGKVFKLKKQRNMLYAVAASLLILITFGIILKTYVFHKDQYQETAWIEIVTKKGERKNIELPDGSKIVLNANASFKYPEKFSPYLREVEMQGEAFFKIKHNPKKPFIVKAANTTTTVLGTEFNVKALQKDSLVTVSLVQGKVEVFSGQDADQAEVLQPRQEWVYHKRNELAKIQKFEIDKVTGWRNNHFVFDFEPLPEVIKTLERHFDTKIILDNPNLHKCLVRLNLKNTTLLDIIAAIAYGDNIEYEIKDSIITLKGKGC